MNRSFEQWAKDNGHTVTSPHGAHADRLWKQYLREDFPMLAAMQYDGMDKDEAYAKYGGPPAREANISGGNE